MPDGTLLNRYWDARDTPRDESYTEDVVTSRDSPVAPAAEVYRDLRAGAESGWDFSSRWLADGKTLATIHTTDLVPVDLNSLLWHLETSIARRCAAMPTEARDSRVTRQDAHERDQPLSVGRLPRRFVDWDLHHRARHPVDQRGDALPAVRRPRHPAAGRRHRDASTARAGRAGRAAHHHAQTGQQWDPPNGWAPLLWVGVAGLDRYGKTRLPRISRGAGCAPSSITIAPGG